MTEFNKYNLYSMQYGQSVTKQDEVDTLVESVKLTKDYYELKEFLVSKFGEFNGKKWVDYDELHKSVYLNHDGENIEFCALKNDTQYFGKGFKLISKNN